jgi:hypothetical protein
MRQPDSGRRSGRSKKAHSEIRIRNIPPDGRQISQVLVIVYRELCAALDLISQNLHFDTEFSPKIDFVFER